jgi:hypothetical protein
MKNSLILITLIFGALMTFTACNDCGDSCPNGYICVDGTCEIDPNADPCILTVCAEGLECVNGECIDANSETHAGGITADETWAAGKVHILSGRVWVEAGATLTIEAGTIVKALGGTDVNASALIVARGAKINACGTAANPIVFTTIADDITVGGKFGTNLDVNTYSGLWGGIVILGNAPISPSSGTETNIEGIPADLAYGLYGGADANDNSGSLCYVSIRYGGALIGEGNELNGLTLGGVGKGTIINHIEVVSNVDDGIEFFGGTVNVDDALVMLQGDDGFDVDQAYSGMLNNYIYIAGANSDHALEIDGPEGSENASGAFTFLNGSVFGGSEASGALVGAGEMADFRSDAKGTVMSTYFANWRDNSDIELDNEEVVSNWRGGLLNVNGNQFSNAMGSTLETIANATTGGQDDIDFDAYFTTNNTMVASPTLGAIKAEFTGWTVADHLGYLN